MKKFLFSFLTPLLVSLFFFIPQVKADTYNISVSSSDANIPNVCNFNNLFSSLDTYMSNNNYNYYVITTFDAFSTELQIFLYSSLPTISNSWNRSQLTITLSTSVERWHLATYNCTTDVFSPQSNTNTNNISTFLTISNNETSYYNRTFGCLAKNFEIIATSSIPIVNISYNGSTITIEEGTNIPSLYEILVPPTPPTPPDNTPVLTSFYTLVIDKFSVLADFFTNNTYLFAIPLIPILILCIYLIKRSLIK